MRLHPLITVYNHSESGLADSEVDTALLAFKHACDYHFEPYWNATAAFQRLSVGQVLTGKDIAELHLLGISDEAGALGYHLDQTGRPIMRVFVQTDKQYNLSWTVTATHEIFEMLADPWCLLASQSPTSNKFYGYEVGDPVEGDQFAYNVNGVKISDFVTPAWFSADPGPNDYARHTSAPFQVLPDGYCSIYQNGKWTSFQQRGGELVATTADDDVDHPSIRNRSKRRDYVNDLEKGPVA